MSSAMAIPDPPLAATLAAARERLGGFDLLATRIGRPDGWRPAPEVHVPGPAFDELLAHQVRSTTTDRADIGGTWLIEGYSWALAVRGVGVLLLGDQVPHMPRDETYLDVSEESGITAMAFPGDVYDDADDDALLACLRSEIETHLEPLIATTAAATDRAETALWRSAGDRLGGAFLWLGEVLGMRDRAWGLGTLCLSAGGRLASQAEFRVIEHAGITEPTRNRLGCCLLYRTGEHDTCFTCPLTPEHERLERLAARTTT